MRILLVIRRGEHYYVRVMKKTSIKVNLLYQTFYEILIIIIPLFTSPYISRILGAENLGIYSYTYAVAYYFQVFAMLGIKFYGSRTIARIRDDRDELDRVCSELLTLHMLAAAVSCTVYVLYAVFLAEYTTYAFLQGFIVLGALFDVNWLFFGLEDFKIIVKINTVIKVLSVVMIFVLIRSEGDLLWYVLIMAGAQFLGQLILFAASFRYVAFKFPRLRALVPHIKPLLILFIPLIAISVYKYMDKIMLGLLSTKTQLGFYENAEKILNVPLSAVIAFGNVMLPKMSNLVSNRKGRTVEKYLAMPIKYMMCLSIAIAFGMAAVADVFSPFFWGSEFAECGTLIQLLAISVPFSALASIIRNQDLLPRGKDAYYSYAILGGAFLNLILNWILIPRFQAVGAALGTVAAEMFVCVVEVIIVRKEHAYGRYILQALIYLIPGVIMYLAVYNIGRAMSGGILTLLLQVLSGVVIYASLTCIYFAATKDEEFMKLCGSGLFRRK